MNFVYQSTTRPVVTLVQEAILGPRRQRKLNVAFEVVTQLVGVDQGLGGPLLPRLNSVNSFSSLQIYIYNIYFFIKSPLKKTI